MAKRWGLALGAGGLYGLAYVGVFKALADAGLRPDVVSGTSAGAIAAGLYAAGVALDDIERELRQMAVPSRWVVKGIPAIARGLTTRAGMVDGDLIERELDRLLGGRSVSDVHPPVVIEAVDIETGELVVMSTLESPGIPPLARTSWLADVRLSEAIRASSSIPGVFVPKLLDGRKLVDGAVRDMVPAAVLRALGAECVVAVDLLSGQEQPVRVDNAVEIIARAIGLLEREAIRERLTSLADVVIAPVLPPPSASMAKNIERYSRAGEEETRRYIPQIRRLLAGPTA